MKPFNLEEFIKNPARKVVTRKRIPVRILCTDAVGEYPIVALVKNENKEFANNFTKDGRLYKDSKDDRDLFFAPEKKEGWVSLYRNVRGNLVFGLPYCTKEEALDELYDDTDTRIDTIKVEWTE